MSRFISYTKVQFKRVLRIFPLTFLMTVVLAAVILMIFWLQMQMQEHSAENQKVILGVVGESNGEYMGFGLYTLQNVDSSRFSIDIQQLENEDEAREKLVNGEIGGYLFIPHGFMQSVIEGSNKTVKLVINKSGLYADIISELSKAVSKAITESQAGVFALQECYAANGYPREIKSDSQELNMSYFDLILGREELYGIEEYSGNPEIGFDRYYICAGLVLFMMLCGMNGAVFLIRGDNSLSSLLRLRGISPLLQCAGEFFAYYVPNAAAVFAVCIVLHAFGYDPGIAEPLLVLVCIAAMQYLMFSIVSRLTEGLMLNFILTAALGYISGCFYPIGFFPESIQALSSMQPVGASVNLLQEQAAGCVSPAGVFIILAWSAVLFALAVTVRYIKIEIH